MAKKKAVKPKGQIPPPKCKAILLCERVVIDALSDQCSIFNIIENFFISQYPGHTVPFFVYMQLTDGIGEYSIEIEVHDLVDGTIAARTFPQLISFDSRQTRVHFISPYPPMLLDHPGIYDFVVLADNQEIDRQKFSAPPPQTQEHDDEEDEAEDPGEE